MYLRFKRVNYVYSTGIKTKMLPETFVLLIVIVSVKGTEPECSRFHYEEQTLEKMIRQEIRVEAMKAEMGETKKQIDLALEALKQEKESFKIEMEEMKKAQSLEKERLVRELAEIKDRLSTPNVAFQSIFLKNRQPVNGEILIFKNASFNLGGGYDPNTGVFRAPHAGIYSFSLNLCLEVLNSAVFYEIRSSQMSILKGRLVNPNGSYYGCHSVNAPARLQERETVYVVIDETRISGASGGKIVFWEHEWLTNQFAGFLVNTGSE